MLTVNYLRVIDLKHDAAETDGFVVFSLLTVMLMIIPSLGTGGPYPQQR